MKKLLNCGCGNRYHDEWTNVNFYSSGKDVIAYDLLNGIPFQNEMFDVVYHSHVIEHFSKENAFKFLIECNRVLKPNGVIRVVFPDLEQIVHHYIRLLTELKNGNMEFESDYDWIMLELYDQTVRNVSGGNMFRYFVRETIPNEEFVLKRCGTEAKALIEAGKRQFAEESIKRSLLKNTGQSASKSLLKKIKRKITKIISNDKYSENYFIGKFRMGGEIHQCMYDSFSLSRLLEQTGFKNIIVRDAHTSYVDGWQKYNLDTESDGSVYKPDSGYVEALRS